MASQEDASQRTSRLHALFRGVLTGNRQVKTCRDAQLFLEAVINQEKASQCVESILASKFGLEAIQSSVRLDLGSDFILNHTLPFIRYLADPGVRILVDGQLLRRILVAIAHPPTVWNAMFKLYCGKVIPETGLYPFAWLVLALLEISSETEVDMLKDALAIVEGKSLLKAETYEIREIGYKLEKVLAIRNAPGQNGDAGGPGGRHDNDMRDFRQISIYPTSDEFLSSQRPYYRTVQEVFDTDLAERAGVHLDNQFRLLREDMLAELREDIRVSTGRKKGRRRPTSISDLVIEGLHFGDEDRARPRYKTCCLAVKCRNGLQLPKHMDEHGRKTYLKKETQLLKHQAFGVLCRDQEILGFAFVDRNIDLLAKSQPVVLLQFTDAHGLRNALLSLVLPERGKVQFVLVGTPVFAYEPVLAGLKKTTDLPLQDMLMNPAGSDASFSVQPRLLEWINNLQSRPRDADGTVDLSVRGGVRVDESQLASLIHALTRPVSMIQGPPGTGKSFLGAQIAKAIVRFTSWRILVLSYTNHALNQFLEDLIKVGIAGEHMARLGSKAKSSPLTQPVLLSEQRSSYRRSRDAWRILDDLKVETAAVGSQLRAKFHSFRNFSPSWRDVLGYLEFSEEESHFFEGLFVSEDTDGWRRVGEQGAEASPDYLWQRWTAGMDAGVFGEQVGASPIWNMPLAERRQKYKRWMRSLVEERLASVEQLARKFNESVDAIDCHSNETDMHMLRQKRIIGCTTTGAAKYMSLIRAAEPDLVLVEEAGEILESHILTAMAPSVKQLVLIGDHKQLRPKCNNYDLTVEKGDGFDLNRSLFERMILQGASHATLTKQHRMAPEISVFARRLTYPELVDGPATAERVPMRGVRDRVVFLNHAKLEETDEFQDRREPSGKSSKKNKFEAQMVLRLIKYFGQQGYSSEQIVVLTPYLGQLRLIGDVLQSNRHDAEITELDKFDLIRAGLMTSAAAQVGAKPIRISTIDNYQGEESEIVIASLTRSNDCGDIGFMSAPERLNVLMTRARNCIVMIGNMDTFMNSKRGKETWHPFFELLKEDGHLYDGLPVRCEKHPDRLALLQDPTDFDKCSPDGGCTELWCKSRCHRIGDHSKTECRELVNKVCERQHSTSVACERRQNKCGECIKEDQDTERRLQRDLKLEEERVRRQAEYAKQLQAIQDELEHTRRVMKKESEEEEQRRVLEQQRADLADLQEAQSRLQQRKKQQAKKAPKAAVDGTVTETETAQVRKEKKKRDSSGPVGTETAEEEWEQMKEYEGASSQAMDSLMSMIGLEQVKQCFLSIKSKVDTATRQGIDLKTERFGCSLLGNPGTGKTSVGRLYARFLTSVGVIAGTAFEETTGAALANMGVSGCKKVMDEILNKGGGVVLIDEAYQLTSGNNPGGNAVLDYLLPEMENLTGKLVFVLAGYSRQMESFFAHNPGLPSRFPVDMKFDDYTDHELLRILRLKMEKRYGGAMKCADGGDGLFCRIVSRRIGRGRGRDGFGNARTVENTVATISRRQADRLRRERRKGMRPDDLLFTKEDLIGPEPAEALKQCKAWQKLQDLSGLAAVKEAVQALADSIQQNYQRELDEAPPIEYSLNKVFLGNPGTGKTTVAKLYGEMLAHLELLSKGEGKSCVHKSGRPMLMTDTVLVKNPSDFVGAFLGHSEQQTKGILASCVGKVLVIDEAYGLYGGGDGQASKPDAFKTAVIDTIVAEVQGVPGDDRCILLLGYREQMEKMFQHVNPGLSRRFPIADAFHFDDFSDQDLAKILDLKLKQIGFEATEQAKRVAMEMLKRARNRPNFGNAGEIDIILNSTKARHQRRLARRETDSSATLEARDFDADFDRGERAETNVRKLFAGTVGNEEIMRKLEGYQDTVRTMKSLELDAKGEIPFNFLFCGPPGTGKTTTARKMGKVFYDMGFLATAEVQECSATDLIGQYIGQTGPKVQGLLEKALGRVLFIDEAYRLGEGVFAKEAVHELVDCVTKEKFHKKLIIILAGYEQDINRLMTVNPGLTSRFPDVVHFRPLSAQECACLLHHELRLQQNRLMSRGKNLDIACLEDASPTLTDALRDLFGRLAKQKDWASARDVQLLGRRVFNRLIGRKDDVAGNCLAVRESDVVVQLQEMLDERESRSRVMAMPAHTAIPPTALPPTARPAAPAMQPPTAVASPAPVGKHTSSPSDPGPCSEPSVETGTTAECSGPSRSARAAERDAGVSDAVWEQLQRDLRAGEAREVEHGRLLEASRTASAEAREKILGRLLEEEARRKKEAEVRQRLAEMGACPAGYGWVRQEGGYRCAGGSHFMSDGQLATAPMKAGTRTGRVQQVRRT